MSKIGRKPIDVSNVKVEVTGQELVFSGPKASGSYVLPSGIVAQLDTDKKVLTLHADAKNRIIKSLWGLHRSLLANKLRGAAQLFEKRIEIIGLRYKAAKSGKGLLLALGYSNELSGTGSSDSASWNLLFDMPEGVVVQDIDKTGQKITFASHDKELLGHVCSQIRALRPPEPYKGTGIKYKEEVIVRKDGKARSS